MSVEILAPAGNPQCFKAAVAAGANAIYIGLDEFSARKSAENFCVENLDKYLTLAHIFGVKVYVAVNTLVKNSELDKFLDLISKAYSLGVDAFIMQDMLLGRLVKKALPQICLHLSTQAGVCNAMGARLAKDFGFDRVILARETSLADIEEIAKIIETEVFVQGALCSSFSGHCYISSFAGGLSGNRGFCKQPCRKIYTYSGSSFSSFTGYNLSLKDLCLKDKVKELERIGVSSFKIEGRMRSAEYVYSAVRVYRGALLGECRGEDFKNLKTAFNRGDYTEGYLKGFTRDIISNKIQGNIGNFVGRINSCGKTWAKVKSKERFVLGSGFKILRDGYEVGNGVYEKSIPDGFSISAAGEFKEGDLVYITKDKALAERVEASNPKIDLSVKLYFKVGERAKAILACASKSIEVFSDFDLVEATKLSVTEKELVNCFQKIDDYPFNPLVSVEYLEDVFVAKSQLNAFRRKCFLEMYNTFSIKREIPDISINDCIPQFTPDVNLGKIAVIISDFEDVYFGENILYIYKPIDYSNTESFKRFLAKFASAEKYLYLPPYASGQDLTLLEDSVKGFDGVFAEGYYGIAFAIDNNVKLFLGTGFNLFNSASVAVAATLTNFSGLTYSKELTTDEIKDIGLGGFVFSAGCVQVMDLIYCPFSGECDKCNRRDIYSLTDEGGREYKVRRYKLSRCRFEVYNPFDLVADVKGNRLYDCTLYSSSKTNSVINATGIDDLKDVLPNYTRGNLTRGIK